MEPTSAITVGIERAKAQTGGGDSYVLDHYENLFIQPQDDLISIADTGFSQSLRAFCEVDADIQPSDRVRILETSRRLTTNLITNGLMEEDANWADVGTLPVNERSTEQVYQGTYSRKFTANTNNDGIQSDSLTTENGSLYVLKFAIYSSDNTSARVRLRSGDNADWLLDEVVTLALNEWNEFEYEITGDSDGSNTYFVVNSDGNSSGSYYVDSVLLKKANQINQRYEIKALKKYDFGSHPHLEISLEEFRENVVE